MIFLNVRTLTPRGYCHGVVDALKMMRDIAHDQTIKRPIYVLGMVVHNQKIVNDFSALGLYTLDTPGKTRLELLDEIDEGSVVFTAHGVADQVYEKAKAKGLNIIDTTCKDVRVSQSVIKDYLTQGYDVIFVGKKNHPETETALSYSNRVHAVETKADLDKLDSNLIQVALTNQTTLSFYDLYHIIEAAKAKYHTLTVIEEICDATKTRQNAVKQLPSSIDYLFVVGSKRSNNANQLLHVAKQRGLDGALIESVEALDLNTLKTLKHVGVTSAASTPTALTKEVVEYLKTYDPLNPKPPVSQALHTNLFNKKT